MAKYDVLHSCGHTKTHQLIGPYKGREYRLDVLRGSVCADCYAQQRQAASTMAASANHEAGLPQLIGSPKQVLWAESIRHEICCGTGKHPNLSVLRDKIAALPDSDLRTKGLDACVQITNQTAAGWWIDMRYKVAEDLINLILRNDNQMP